MRETNRLVSLVLAAFWAPATLAGLAPARADRPKADARPQTRPATPPGGEYLGHKLDPFYTKHVSADGLLISASDKVPDYALKEAAYLIRSLLAKRPDVRKALIRAKVRVGVMAYNEMTTDIPEHSKLSPWYDMRARGLGNNPVTCGEENLLAYRGDPYRGENIFIHEFAHIVHGRGLAAVDPTFNKRLLALYEKAKHSGRFRGYGLVGEGEFWAEGVQSWFNCNRGGGLEIRKPDGKRLAVINTRKQLRAHLPEFAKLLATSFGNTSWTYVPVLQRLSQPHLKGYDPAKAPVFRWPRKVLEAVKKIRAEKARRKKAAKAGKKK